jgi:hypothetical protein
MRKGTMMLAVVCAAMGLEMPLQAIAQNPNVGVTNPSPPTVSPYVSLWVNSNGISNYQTIVRPLLTQRESMTRPPTPQRPGQQSRDPRASRHAQGGEARDATERAASRRFMNYSHYFGALR